MATLSRNWARQHPIHSSQSFTLKRLHMLTRKTVSLLLLLAFPPGLLATASHAANVGININIGGPPLIAPPPPVYRPVPHFYFETRPNLVFMDGPGFYMAVGSPYDMFFHKNIYYIYNNGYWYQSARYNGPWVIVEHRRLPSVFHRHDVNYYRRYRDNAYHHRPGHSNHPVYHHPAPPPPHPYHKPHYKDKHHGHDRY